MPNSNTISVESISEGIKIKIREQTADETRKIEKLVQQRTREVNECKQKRTKYVEAIEIVQKEYQEGLADIRAAKQRLQTLPREIRQQRDSLPLLSAKVSESHNRITSIQQLLNQIELQISGLIKPVNNSTYDADLATYQQTIQTLNKQLNTTEKQIKSLENKVSSAERGYQSACAELEHFDWNDESFSKNQLHAKYSTLERRVDDKQHTLRRFEHELDDVRANLTRINIQKSQLVEPIDDGKYAREYDLYRNQLEQLEQKRACTYEDFEIAKADKLGLESEAQEAQSAIASMEQEMIDLENSIPDLEKNVLENKRLLDNQKPGILDDLDQNIEASQRALNQAKLQLQSHQDKIQQRIEDSIAEFRTSRFVTSGEVDAINTIQVLNASWTKFINQTNLNAQKQLTAYQRAFDSRVKEAEDTLQDLIHQQQDAYSSIYDEYASKLSRIDSRIDADEALHNNNYITYVERSLSYSHAKEIVPDVEEPSLDGRTAFLSILGGAFTGCPATLITVLLLDISGIDLPRGAIISVFLCYTVVFSVLIRRWATMSKSVEIIEFNPLSGTELQQARQLRSNYLKDLKEVKTRIQEQEKVVNNFKLSQKQRQKFTKNKKPSDLSSYSFQPFIFANTSILKYKDSLVDKYSGDIDKSVTEPDRSVFVLHTPQSDNDDLNKALEKWSRKYATKIDFVESYRNGRS